MNNPNGRITTNLTLRQAAEYLGCSKAFLWGECKAKRITHTHIGNRIKISMIDLDLYRAENTVTKVDEEATLQSAGGEK